MRKGKLLIVYVEGNKDASRVQKGLEKKVKMSA